MKSALLLSVAAIWLVSVVHAGWVPSKTSSVEFRAPQKGDMWSADCSAPGSCQFQVRVPSSAVASMASAEWKVGLFQKRALWFDKLVYARAFDGTEVESELFQGVAIHDVPALKNGKYYLAVFRPRRMFGRRFLAKSQVFSITNKLNNYMEPATEVDVDSVEVEEENENAESEDMESQEDMQEMEVPEIQEMLAPQVQARPAAKPLVAVNLQVDDQDEVHVDFTSTEALRKYQADLKAIQKQVKKGAKLEKLLVSRVRGAQSDVERDLWEGAMQVYMEGKQYRDQDAIILRSISADAKFNYDRVLEETEN